MVTVLAPEGASLVEALVGARESVAGDGNSGGTECRRPS